MKNQSKILELEYAYRILSENALESIWVLDVETQKFTYMSPNVYSLRGITAEQVKQESLRDALPKKAYEKAMENTRRMVALYHAGERRMEKLSAVEDMQLYTKDGSIKQVEVTVKLTKNAETGALEIIGVSRDITDRKQLEAELQQAVKSKNEVIKRLEISEKALQQLTEELNRKNETLREIAISDALTGTYNRYYFDQKVLEESERCQRYVYPLSLIMFDIDRFKDINDTWGHDVGDFVLKRIANAVNQHIRKQDMLARWGGEEFVILMPHTKLSAATRAAEKLCTMLAALQHPEINKKVTASFGVTEFMHGESKSSWFRRVDHAMFSSKGKGRNRVTALTWMEAFPYVKVSLEWSRDWESGNSTIDSQHQRLIALSDQTIDAMLDPESNKLGPAMAALLEHIRLHFHEEETLLNAVAYPDAKAHAETHDTLLADARVYYDQFLSGDLKISAFFSFLLDHVIIGHILQDDFRYFPYVKEHGDSKELKQTPAADLRGLEDNP